MFKLQILLEYFTLKKHIRTRSKLNEIKSGFTLAEVLITLLIIGVVASIIIPTLVNNTQEAEFKTSAKKAFSEISNVVKQMQQEKGTLNEYIGKDCSFKPDFVKYFNIVKDCGCHNCVSAADIPNIYKTLSNDNADDMASEGQFITNDGMFINIQNSANVALGIMIHVDVNGYTKGPNVYGKDVFVFQLVNDTLFPMGSPGTLYSNRCNRNSHSTIQGYTCILNVLQDKDY